MHTEFLNFQNFSLHDLQFLMPINVGNTAYSVTGVLHSYSEHMGPEFTKPQSRIYVLICQENI